MNPVSVDIKDFLVSQQAGEFGVDLFIGKEPSDPANCLTLFDTGGGEQNAKLALDDTDLQIRVRDVNYLDGYAKLNSVKLLLEGKESFVVNANKYIGIWATSNIAFMKRDENDRSIFTANFRLTREPSETGNRQNY